MGSSPALSAGISELSNRREVITVCSFLEFSCYCRQGLVNRKRLGAFCTTLNRLHKVKVAFFNDFVQDEF
jgi:hypothetical protein